MHPNEFWDSWRDLTDDFPDYPDSFQDRFEEGSGLVSSYRTATSKNKLIYNIYSYKYFFNIILFNAFMFFYHLSEC